MADADVVAGWDAVYDALARLPAWEAVRPVYHVEKRLWIVTAHYKRPRQGSGTRGPSWRRAGLQRRRRLREHAERL